MDAITQYQTAVWELESERAVARPQPLDATRFTHHEKVLNQLWNTLNNAERQKLDSLQPKKALIP